MNQRFPIQIRMPVLAVVTQLGMFLGLYFLAVLVHGGDTLRWETIELPLTYLCLGMGAFGGLLALWGLYAVLARSRFWVALIMIPGVILPTLIIGALCSYLLFALLPVI